MFRIVGCGTLAACIFLFVLLYISHIPEKEELLIPYISDGFGENCEYKGKYLAEGQVFSETCKDCYCSFGVVECADSHCKFATNTLGMRSITRDIQVVIPTNKQSIPGTIAVMNSVLTHTQYRVKFTIVMYTSDSADSPNVDKEHLEKWISSTHLRYANYVVKLANKDWFKKDFSVFAEIKTGITFTTKDLEKEYSSLIDTPTSAMLMLNSILPLEHKVVLLGNNIIVKGDIVDFVNFDLKGKFLAVLNNCRAVQPPHPLFFNSYFKGRLPDQFQVPKSTCIFSRNVIVADLDKWHSAQTERQLALILYNVIRGKNDLQTQDTDSLCFAPLLLRFWNSAGDLNTVWNVWNVYEKTNLTRVKEAKLLNWEQERPWESQSKEWTQYFVNDPTGLFRLGDSTSRNVWSY